jgi:hypothetical protein
MRLCGSSTEGVNFNYFRKWLNFRIDRATVRKTYILMNRENISHVNNGIIGKTFIMNQDGR